MDNSIGLIILGVLNLILIAGHLLYVKESNKEKSKLVNALVSKSVTEMRDLELTDKVEPIKPEMPEESPLIPEAELTDEEFMERIK